MKGFNPVWHTRAFHGNIETRKPTALHLWLRSSARLFVFEGHLTAERLNDASPNGHVIAIAAAKPAAFPNEAAQAAVPVLTKGSVPTVFAATPWRLRKVALNDSRARHIFFFLAAIARSWASAARRKTATLDAA